MAWRKKREITFTWGYCRLLRGYIRSPQVIRGDPKSFRLLQVPSGHVRSLVVTSGQLRSPHVTLGYVSSAQGTIDRTYIHGGAGHCGKIIGNAPAHPYTHIYIIIVRRTAFCCVHMHSYACVLMCNSKDKNVKEPSCLQTYWVINYIGIAQPEQPLGHNP